MVDVTPELLQEFKANGIILIPENSTDSTTKLPCVTYMEQGNNDYAIGDTVGYSDISYLIQVWTKDSKTMADLCAKVDNIMKSVFFKRVTSNYQNIGDFHRKILTYERLLREDFNT